jgi:hypothetical protein
MASGDDVKAGDITAAEKTTVLLGQIPTGDNPPPFNGDFIFQVSSQRSLPTRPNQTLNAILGIGANGVLPNQRPTPGGTGVAGIGGLNQGTGVSGKGGGQGAGGIGVIGEGGRGFLAAPFFSGPGAGVFGRGGDQDQDDAGSPHAPGVIGVGGGQPPIPATIGSAGVFGQGGSAARHTETIDNRPVVVGPRDPGPGILGRGAFQSQDGNVSGNPSAGVIGLAGDVDFPPFSEASNAGVYGKGKQGVIGVAGKDFGDNVANTLDPLGVGVLGVSNAVTAQGGIAMVALSKNSPDVPALLVFNDKGNREAAAFAAFFDGNVVTTGTKSAGFRQQDGSYRLLYAIESPENWFEDFGEGQLAGGKAEVALDPRFAELIVVHNYQVFVTPYGDSKGLFVVDRRPASFRVQEQQAGTSDVCFAYRVVGKRKDVVATRWARVSLPTVPSSQSP